jgi:hypothetical protein
MRRSPEPALSGQRASYTNDEHDDDCGDCAEGRDDADGVAQVTVLAAEHVRGEGEGGEKQEGIGEVQGEVPGAERRLALCGEAEFYQQCSEDGFE